MTHAEVERRHRWLFARPRPDGMKHGIDYGLEIGPGWLALVDRALTRIGEVVRDLPDEERQAFAIVQIKEKFASLRLYYHRPRNKRIDAIITDAVAESERTCEECGGFGLTHVFRESWFWTLCGPCAQERARTRGGSVRAARYPGEKN